MSKEIELAFLTLLESSDIKPSNEFFERIEALKNSRHPHADIIMQVEQDKIDYPDFWWSLTQWKIPTNTKWAFLYDDVDFRYDDNYRPHPHRESIIAWHACSDEDKNRWQYRNGIMWFDLSKIGEKPTWAEETKYRLRPRVCSVLVNGVVYEFPEPCREPLQDGDEYFLVDVIYGINRCFWDCENSKHYTRLDARLIQLTQDGAEQHLIALQAVNMQVAQ